MFSRRSLLVVCLSAACLSLVSCSSSLSETVPAVSVGQLLQLADAYAGPAPAKPVTGQQMDANAAAEVDPNQTEEDYKLDILADLRQGKFDALEQAAHFARLNKTRFKGGVWKLCDFYEAVDGPQMDEASDSDWQYHMGLVKAWVAARPNSGTARIALARFYALYGDFARGSGTADTVTTEGWGLFNQRYAVSASILVDAAKLQEKSPIWFESLLSVAAAQGWDKTQERQILEDAMRFEPEYYHIYRDHADFLLPKWYGNPGETEAFAEEISNRIGGKEGKFLYFEIASLATCDCGGDDSHMQYLSWPKIKEGYVALGDLYGYSNIKINRFAHMAVAAGDRAAAQQAFAAIGDDWNQDVLGSSQRFTAARAWAEVPGQ